MSVFEKNLNNQAWKDLKNKLSSKKKVEKTASKKDPNKIPYKEAEAKGMLKKARSIGFGVIETQDDGGIWEIETDATTGEKFLIKQIDDIGEIVRRHASSAGFRKTSTNAFQQAFLLDILDSLGGKGTWSEIVRKGKEMYDALSEEDQDKLSDIWSPSWEPHWEPYKSEPTWKPFDKKLHADRLQGWMESLENQGLVEISRSPEGQYGREYRIVNTKVPETKEEVELSSQSSLKKKAAFGDYNPDELSTMDLETGKAQVKLFSDTLTDPTIKQQVQDALMLAATPDEVKAVDQEIRKQMDPSSISPMNSPVLGSLRRNADKMKPIINPEKLKVGDTFTYDQVGRGLDIVQQREEFFLQADDAEEWGEPFIARLERDGDTQIYTVVELNSEWPKIFEKGSLKGLRTTAWLKVKKAAPPMKLPSIETPEQEMNVEERPMAEVEDLTRPKVPSEERKPGMVEYMGYTFETYYDRDKILGAVNGKPVQWAKPVADLEDRQYRAFISEDPEKMNQVLDEIVRELIDDWKKGVFKVAPSSTAKPGVPQTDEIEKVKEEVDKKKVKSKLMINQLEKYSERFKKDAGLKEIWDSFVNWFNNLRDKIFGVADLYDEGTQIADTIETSTESTQLAPAPEVEVLPEEIKEQMDLLAGIERIEKEREAKIQKLLLSKGIGGLEKAKTEATKELLDFLNDLPSKQKTYKDSLGRVTKFVSGHRTRKKSTQWTSLIANIKKLFEKDKQITDQINQLEAIATTLPHEVEDLKIVLDALPEAAQEDLQQIVVEEKDLAMPEQLIEPPLEPPTMPTARSRFFRKFSEVATSGKYPLLRKLLAKEYGELTDEVIEDFATKSGQEIESLQVWEEVLQGIVQDFDYRVSGSVAPGEEDKEQKIKEAYKDALDEGLKEDEAVKKIKKDLGVSEKEVREAIDEDEDVTIETKIEDTDEEVTKELERGFNIGRE